MGGIMLAQRLQEVFPGGFQDSTVRTPVLVGLLIVWFFQETFGWNFTGLVVPGYLAAVLAVEPVVGAVMLVEALLTWLVATAVMDWMPHSAPLSRPFGRDRFFLMLAASIGVRLLVEGALLEWIGPGLGSETARTLHSVGLVVVPLAANALWRTGLALGLSRLLVTTGLTWAVIEWVLLPYTNLSLEGFRLAFEDPALSFLESPRSYLILMIGALAGSVANERYGWDFGGIIVPGLLAFLWLDPIRLIVTLLEAVIIAGLFLGAARLPGLAGANLTGGRPLVLAYVLGYLWKLGLAWAGEWSDLSLPEAVRDPFGFGYLLSAILALRIVKTKRPAVVLLPTLMTSAAGFGLATLLEAGLQKALPARVEVAAEERLAASSHQELLLSPPPAPRPALDLPGLIYGSAGEGQGQVLTIAGLGAISAQRCPAALAGQRGLVLSATEGAPLIRASAVALAEELGACAVLICSAPGLACDQARGDIRLAHDVLEITAGSDDRLWLPAEVANPDLAKLSTVAPTLQITPGAEIYRLQLDQGPRFRAAEMFGAIEPVPLAEPRTEIFPLAETVPAPLPAPGRIRELLAAPLLLWEQGDDRGLRVAAHTAHQIGAALQLGRDRAGREVILVAGPDWEMILRREGGEPRPSTGPMVVGSSLAATPDIPPLARAIAEQVDARAMVIDFPPVWEIPERALARPATVLALALLEAAGKIRPGAAPEVYSLFGTPDPTHTDAEITVGMRGLGRWEGLRSPLAIRLGVDPHGDLRWPHGPDVPVAGIDGAATRAPEIQSVDRLRPALEAAGAEVLLVHAGEALRRSLQPLTADHPIRQALARAAIPPLPAEPGLPVEWPVDGTHLEILRLLRMGRAADLRALQRRGLVGLACDPLLGCRWLTFARDGRAFLVPLIVGRG